MAYYDYDSPASRLREGLRHWLREILVCMVIVGIPAAIFMAFASPQGGILAFILVFMIVGIPGGIVLWLVYRILRFALAR